jgi:hypothetical protein
MRRSILVLAGAIVIAAGGVSYAITGNTTITACVEPANQTLSLAPAGGCPGGQQTLSWNQQGPQGDTGAQGIQGVTGQTGPAGTPGASASDAVLHVAPSVKYRSKFSTSIVIDGIGDHAVSGDVHIHLDAAKWRRDGHVDCQLGDADTPTLDSWTLPVKRKGAVTDMDLELDGIVTITPPPSSQTVQSTAPTAVTVQFGCKTTSPGTGQGAGPLFSFVRMSDELLKNQIVKLPVKEAVLQIKKTGQ